MLYTHYSLDIFFKDDSFCSCWTCILSSLALLSTCYHVDKVFRTGKKCALLKAAHTHESTQAYALLDGINLMLNTLICLPLAKHSFLCWKKKEIYTECQIPHVEPLSDVLSGKDWRAYGLNFREKCLSLKTEEGKHSEDHMLYPARPKRFEKSHETSRDGTSFSHSRCIYTLWNQRNDALVAFSNLPNFLKFLSFLMENGNATAG